MRIVVADYSGHPFQVQLSRELARRGHDVLHLYFAEFQTPHGRLAVEPGDPPGFAVEPVSLGRPFAKHSLLRRRFQEIAAGKAFAARLRAFAPQAVIASNLPLDALRVVQKACRRWSVKFVFWQQDIYSVAIERFLSEKYGALGRLIGGYYKRMEKAALKASDQVVVISEYFLDFIAGSFGVDHQKVHVIENWAPLDEIRPQDKDNAWSRRHGLADKTVLLYTGTLGLKHDPALILALAEAFRDSTGVEIVVTSEGPGAQWLANSAAERGLRGLRVMGFQPFSDYPMVLGSASALLCLLDSNSGSFSVPSKALSYLCAGRPIVMSAPAQNLAARTVKEAQAGVVVEPGDATRLIEAVKALVQDQDRCFRAGLAGRKYAEKTFDVAFKADRFELVLGISPQAGPDRVAGGPINACV